MTNSLQRFAERLTKLERNMRAASSSPQLGTSSIENGGAIKDKGPDGTTYQFFGKQFDGTHTVSQINGPNPPAPTFPGASPAYNTPGMIVSWDGMFEDGAFGPMDLLRVDVHVLDEDHQDPLMYVPAGALLAGAGGSVSILLDPGEYWAVLVAWTTSGKYAISGASNLVNVVAPTIDPPDPSDGVAPTEAPVVTGQAFAVGAVEFQWNPIENEDDVQYDYWASLTSPVSTAGDPTGFVVQPNVRISRLAGTQIPMDGSPVYIKVAARDMDGLGPMSAEASATPVAPDVQAIIAGFVAALEIEASQIRGQFISADLALLSMLQVGDRLDINGNDSTITIYAADLDEEGNKVPLIILDPIGSEFRGRVIADDISVMNGLILKGQNSQIASDSGLTIMAGVATPNFGPSLSATLQTSIWPAVPSGFDERGIAWDSVDGKFLRLLVNVTAASRDGTTKVERIDPVTGAVNWVRLENIPSISVDDFNSVCRYGDWYYSMTYDAGVGWAVSRWLATETVSGNTAAHVSTSPTAWGDDARRPAVGLRHGDPVNDVTTPIVTAAWSETDSFITQAGFYVKSRYPDGVHANYLPPGLDRPIEEGSSMGKDLSYTDRHFDGTDHHLYLGGSSQLTQYLYDSVDDAYEIVPDGTIVLYSSGSRGGIARKTTGDDQGLYSVHNGGSVKYRYSTYNPAAGEKVWAVFANTDDTYITAASPESSIALSRGRFVQVNLPPDSLSAKVYTEIDTADPDLADYRDRLETLTASRTMLIDPTAALGTDAPPVVNTFPGGLSGWLKSQTGGFELNGDGTGDWPLLREQILDEDIPKIQSGQVSLTNSATADTWGSDVDVTFPVAFASGNVPVVVISPDTSSAQVVVATAHTRTNTGFKAKSARPTAGAVARTFSWIAMVP